MSFENIEIKKEKVDYRLLAKTLEVISAGVNRDMTILANASALLYDALPDINWCGFYINDYGCLYLGPFQGKLACTSIPFGEGVCGTAAERKETIRVDNVHLFEGHIACDKASNSEIVIPIVFNSEIYGVLDIDSPLLNRFSEEDQIGLEAFVKILEAQLSGIMM